LTRLSAWLDIQDIMIFRALRGYRTGRCLRDIAERRLPGQHARQLATNPPSTIQDDPDYILDFPDPSDPSKHPLIALGDEDMSDEQQYWRQRAAAAPAPLRERQVDELGRAYAIGRRKSSVACVWVMKGTEGISVNGRNFVDVFHRVDHRDQVLRPLLISGTLGRLSVVSTVRGGGNTGQAEALRHGIAKALQLYDPEFRPPLKKDGLLTRDSRTVESKKYGRKKARKSFQWVKR
jgi:small subunit ribosomal protein S9